MGISNTGCGAASAHRLAGWLGAATATEALPLASEGRGRGERYLGLLGRRLPCLCPPMEPWRSPATGDCPTRLPITCRLDTPIVSILCICIPSSRELPTWNPRLSHPLVLTCHSHSSCPFANSSMPAPTLSPLSGSRRLSLTVPMLESTTWTATRVLQTGSTTTIPHANLGAGKTTI